MPPLPPRRHGSVKATFGSGANVFTDKMARRLAAVLNDRLTSDSDRKAACTLIHTSCYDEANAKLVVDIDIVPQIIKIAKHDGFDSKAEACCALAVLAIHFPEHIVEAIPTLSNLLEAPAVVSGSAAWALSTIAADDDHRPSVYKAKIIPKLIKADQGRLDGRLWGTPCRVPLEPGLRRRDPPAVHGRHRSPGGDGPRMPQRSTRGGGPPYVSIV